MQSPPLLPVALPTSSGSSPGSAHARVDLAPGTLLDARVVSVKVIDSRHAQFEVLLNIGRGEQVTLPGRRESSPGQRVTLEVLPGGRLAFAAPLPANPGTQALQLVEKLLDQALRQRVGAQQSLAQSLSKLASFASRDPSASLPIVSEGTKRILATLPQASELKDASLLREALKNSGLFTEARLAATASQNADAPQPQSGLGNELRVALLRLAERLRSMPPQQTDTQTREQQPPTERALSPINNALMRIELLQLLSLDQQMPRNQEGPANPRWFFELPFLLNGAVESVSIDVLRGGAQSTGAASRSGVWQVILKFDLGTLGSLTATARLQERRLSLQFGSNSADLRALVQRHIEELRVELQRHDIDLWHFVCREESTPQVLHHSRPLISLRT